MARIKDAKLTYWLDEEWIYIKAISKVEFDNLELDKSWSIRFILSPSQTGSSADKFPEMAEAGPFTSFASNMCLSPTVKLQRKKLGRNFNDEKIPVNMKIMPL